jgi:hypothetical protein
MTKAYLNALYEEGTRKELFEWVCKLDGENDQLRDDKRRLDEENALLRKKIEDATFTIVDEQVKRGEALGQIEFWINRCTLAEGTVEHLRNTLKCYDESFAVDILGG